MDKRLYGEIIPGLCTFYDQNADARDKHEKPLWKVEERQHFFSLLQADYFRQSGSKHCSKLAQAPVKIASSFKCRG